MEGKCDHDIDNWFCIQDIDGNLEALKCTCGFDLLQQARSQALNEIEERIKLKTFYRGEPADSFEDGYDAGIKDALKEIQETREGTK
jgi:hypothetical protein